MRSVCLFVISSGQARWQNIWKGTFSSFIVLVTVFSYCAHQKDSLSILSLAHILRLYHPLTLNVTFMRASLISPHKTIWRGEYEIHTLHMRKKTKFWWRIWLGGVAHTEGVLIGAQVDACRLDLVAY